MDWVQAVKASLYGGGPDTTRNPAITEVQPRKPKQRWVTLTGVITYLFEDRGLVDDHIYFTTSCLMVSSNLEVGQKVEVEAAQSPGSDVWLARSVRPIIDKFEEDQRATTVHQHTSKVNHVEIDCRTFILDDGRHLDFSTCVPGYLPYRGDLVRYEVVEKPPTDGHRAVPTIYTKNVRPIRKIYRSGLVTQVGAKFSVIDDTIFFPHSAAAHGFKVQENMPVFVVAIESEQSVGKLRAVYVEPRDANRNRVLKNREPPKDPSSSQGVEIVCTENIGEVQFGTSVVVDIEVRNSSDIDHQLKCFNICTDAFKLQMRDVFDSDDGQDFVALPAKSSLNYSAVFFGTQIGRYTRILRFNVLHFELAKVIEATVVAPDVVAETKSARLPRHLPLNRQNQHRSVGAGFKESVLGYTPRVLKNFSRKNIPKYEIPIRFKEIVQMADSLDELVELRESLHVDNYQPKMSSLVFLEEIAQENALHEFDMFSVSLRRFRDFLCLTIPTLSEGRPSLTPGDKMEVRLEEEVQLNMYLGHIEEVANIEVRAQFHASLLEKYKDQPCNVRFRQKRASFRRYHHALVLAKDLGDQVLFPAELIKKKPLIQNHNVKMKKPSAFFNKNLNDKQMDAVDMVLEAVYRPTPLIIFGPPGTGKTVTMVEGILQVFRGFTHCRVLACAPSNSATDILVERLMESGLVRRSDLIRLNAFGRSQSSLEGIDEINVSNLTSGRELLRKIVVCTCCTAGVMYEYGVMSENFTHVFIDEAGQTTEPEALIPLALTVGNPNAVIVLAGDHCQLGPVIMSAYASRFGLQISLMERLLGCPAYYCQEREETPQEPVYSKHLVTFLVDNYRSKQELLYIPSKLFYQGQLIARVPPPQVAISGLDYQNTRIQLSTFPLIFHGVRGDDVREGTNPSWCNAAEVFQVTRYVEMLLGAAKVPSDEIGVITPYRKQAEKVRQMLTNSKLSGVKVGSVEEFQGQERLAIIISMVRSSEDNLSFDEAHSLGFIGHPKRFNVAVTRARSLLVVIGDPHLLYKDPCWCSLLLYCVDMGSYVGCPLPDLEDQKVMNHVIQAYILDT